MGKSEIVMDEGEGSGKTQEGAGNRDKNIVISIGEMLGQLEKVDAENSNICRIPQELRKMNKKAYLPQFISIGPFHHHSKENDLIANEQYKLQGFNNFLRRIDSDNRSRSLQLLVKNSHDWVNKASKCYAEPIKMDQDKFVKMMLVDACFIVEFFMLHYESYSQSNNGGFLFYQGIKFHILHDLIKLENQVPFFLLQNLFDSIEPIPYGGLLSFKNLTKLSLDELGFGFVFVSEFDINSIDEEPKHLVHFLSLYFVPKSSDAMQQHDEENSKQNNDVKENGEKKREKNNSNEENSKQNNDNKEDGEKKSEKNNSNEENSKQNNDNKEDGEKNNSYEELRSFNNIHPPPITELSESGVIIRKAQKPKYIWSISFKNGVLEIPPLHIYDDFEIMLRNMLAFEQFCTRSKEKHYVTQYVLFMDDLISRKKDVRLLMKAGVIVNNIGGSAKEVSSMFNNLCKFITESRSPHFNHVSKDLSAYCNGRWNRAKASLKRNYFNTPWAIISFIAATLLILFTLLQTIFSAISTFDNGPAS